VLDPIDGTTSFIAGRPIFGTLIALLAGWLAGAGHYRPTHFWRTLGRAALASRRSSTASQPAPSRLRDLADAVLATTSPHLFTNEEADAFMSVAKQVAEKKIVFGGDCYNYGLVASGHIDVVIEAGLKLYDYAALVPVVEGAGGMMADWQGNPLDAGSDGTVIALGDPARLEDVLEAMG
jgi:inositol-phosphate phosphatase / L-galactose 1-phosphate phosphatase / histidinol-phosphatase